MCHFHLSRGNFICTILLHTNVSLSSMFHWNPKKKSCVQSVCYLWCSSRSKAFLVWCCFLWKGHPKSSIIAPKTKPFGFSCSACSISLFSFYWVNKSFFSSLLSDERFLIHLCLGFWSSLLSLSPSLSHIFSFLSLLPWKIHCSFSDILILLRHSVSCCSLLWYERVLSLDFESSRRKLSYP